MTHPSTGDSWTLTGNSDSSKSDSNNRMGKTRDPFKKIRDIKGTFHAKKSTIKDISCKALRKEEGIKKRWHKYTELLKKNLNDPDNHGGMITHLE